jgi:hypothetical protein
VSGCKNEWAREKVSKTALGSQCPRLQRRTNVKRLAYLVPVALFILLSNLPLHAQDGCVDSPENSTAVFGVISSVAILGFMQFRNRFGSRNK